MRHLSKVAEHGTRTGMTARNIAIVWAPNLLRCKELEVGGVAALQGVGVQAVVTEFLISNVDLVFSEDRISVEGSYDFPVQLCSGVQDDGKLGEKFLRAFLDCKFTSYVDCADEK